MGEIQETVIASYAHQIWNQKELRIISQTFHEKVHIHSPLGEFHGIKGMKQFMTFSFNWLR